MRLKISALVVACVILGCSSFPIDPSLDAVQAGDLTLAISSCTGVIQTGLGKCVLKEKTAITAVWRVILPANGNAITDGELSVHMRDAVHSYAIKDKVVEIPFSDFFGQGQWTLNDSGLATATAKVRYKDANGIEHVLQARGHMILLILPEGYDEMPIDSGFQAWGVTCKVQYSTAGRSAVSCQ